MPVVLASAAASLGVVAGFLISYFIRDETSWYPRWFTLAAAVFAIAAGITYAWNTPLWTLGIALAGAFIYALSKPSVPFLALIAGVLGASSRILTSQLLFGALLFATALLMHHAQKKDQSYASLSRLWWFLATPIIIIALRFLQ